MYTNKSQEIVRLSHSDFSLSGKYSEGVAVVFVELDSSVRSFTVKLPTFAQEYQTQFLFKNIGSNPVSIESTNNEQIDFVGVYYHVVYPLDFYSIISDMKVGWRSLESNSGIVDAPFQIGRLPDYVVFNPWAQMYGAARYYDDIQFSVSGGKVPAANIPTFEALVGGGNHKEYSFAVNDYIDLACNEPKHGWLQSSDIECHLHLATKAANATGSNRFAKFQVFFMHGSALDAVAFTEHTFTAEITIPTGTVASMPMYLSMGTLNLPYKIGCQLGVTVKRIAATGGTEYSGNIFITQVGIHALNNFLGSKNISSQ